MRLKLEPTLCVKREDDPIVNYGIFVTEPSYFSTVIFLVPDNVCIRLRVHGRNKGSIRTHVGMQHLCRLFDER